MPIAAGDIHASIGEFQRAYIYKLFIETVPASVQSGFKDANAFSSNVDLYNTKAVFPDRKTDGQKISWGGEFFYVPTVDNSTRETDLEFFDDEPMWVYDFFSACKDLTGNEDNQAGVWGVYGKFDIGIAKVSVDKETITCYRRLKGVRVYGIETDTIEKGATEVSHLKIGIKWDKNIEDKGKRGTKV